MPTGAMPTQKNNNIDKKSENNVDDNNPDINADSNNPEKRVNCGYFVGNFILLLRNFDYVSSLPVYIALLHNLG